MIVEVIYPLESEQISFSVNVKDGVSVRQVILDSKILVKYPELNINTMTIGIYSQIVDLDDIVKDNDRIEIYRDLIIDPKQARSLRADKKREGKSIKDFGA